MKWINEHLNLPTLKQKPHRWTLAALLSPILFGATLYKAKYHLNYVHAKKLFVFDIALLLGTVVLIFSTYAWHTYDPTITDYIMLNVSVVDESHDPITKIASGELITYHIDFLNTSDILLEEPTITLELPEFFQIESVIASSTYNPLEQSIALENILPEVGGHIDIQGRYFGIPEIDESVSVALSYVQAGRSQTETRRAHIISTLRGSLISVAANFESQILSVGTSPFSITFTNTSDIAIEDISIPRYPAASTELLPNEAFIKTESSILIGTLAPEESITLGGTLRTNIAQGQSTLLIPITPAIRFNDTLVPQAIEERIIAVLAPAANVSVTFAANTATPGDTVNATVSINNTGAVPLINSSVLLPSHTNIIDSSRLAYPITNGSIILSANAFPALAQIEPGTSVTFDITLPISYRPTGGTDILFSVLPTLNTVAGTDIPFGVTGPVSNPISIGSALFNSGHALYYTPEGDQLGRGPLPPRVGEETRYMSVIAIENTSSRLRNVRLSGTLPANVRFTGKTSVSAGNDITYDEASRVLSWDSFAIPAYQTTGLYIELGITPTIDMVGTHTTLLENITLSATDAHTGVERSMRMSDITTLLDEDAIGKAKGDIIVN